MKSAERQPFGNTGLLVPRVGFGASSAGDPALPEGEAERLLHSVLDAGVGLIDTARSYGLSEARIGRHLGRRRDEFVLSTKVGYGVPAFEDWTGPCVSAGVDLALATLETERLDIAHLHSPPIETLRRDDVLEALTRAVDTGKIRVAAYSGENEPLHWAVSSGRFGGIQCSVNVCDQRGLRSGLLGRARERGIGVLAKRPLANAAWRDVPPNPADAAAAIYRERWRALALELGGVDPAEFAIRFTLSQPEVDCAIVGTGSIEHLGKILAAAERGPLPSALLEASATAFERGGAGWEGLV